MEFKGMVTHIGTKETFGENYTKISIRLEEVGDKQYPQSVAIDFRNKMLEQAEKLNVGDIVSVSYSLRSNESKKEAGKFFNSISAWKVNVIDNSGTGKYSGTDKYSAAGEDGIF